MVFFLIFVCFIIMSNARVFPQNEFNQEYLSKVNTKGIKGIFVVLVLFTHFAQYVTLDSIWDEPYMALRSHHNQMIVVPFLFYSGYGIMKSIQKGGRDYVKSIMKKRFPKLWFDFCIAVLCFWGVDLAIGKIYPIKKVLLSLIGWDSIGNSNWYILGTLILYIMTYIAFNYINLEKKKNQIIGCTILTVLTMMVVFIFMKVERPDYYYNTLMIFPVGCWYALLQEKVEILVMKNDFKYIVSLTIIVCMYCISYVKRWEYGIEGYTIWAVMFVTLMLLITMKFSFKSNILQWLGEHVFSIYILQRVPMTILSHLGIGESHKYMFLIMSLFITLVMAIVFEQVVEKLKMLLCGLIRRNYI